MNPISFRAQQTLAFAAIYLIWGSTFLGIRYAIETLPGFTMAAARFSIAGLLFLSWSRFQGEPWPTLRQWRSAAIIGALLLLCGNGAVVWSEQHVASGLVALVVATEPVWVAVLLRLQGERLTSRMVWGVGLGFAGAALLTAPGLSSAEPVPLLPAAITVLGSLSWAAGSLYGRNAELPRSVLQASGMQMVSGGLLLALAGAWAGEWAGLDLSSASPRSWGAFVYLLVFGSLIGFSAYGWLMRTTAPSLVATYAFVNPVVAVFLGWLLAGEELSWRTFAAAVLVVASVILVSFGTRGRSRVSLQEPSAAEVRPENPS